MDHVDPDGFTVVSHKKAYKNKHQSKGNFKIKLTASTKRIVTLPITDILSKLVKYRDELYGSNFWDQFTVILKNSEVIQMEMKVDQSINKDSLKQVATESCSSSFPVICYGIGEFADNLISSYQMALLLALRDTFQVSECMVYDPVFCEQEKQSISELNMKFLESNEEGKRRITSPTVFYMPHCGKPLYNNLLWANWSVESLQHLVIIGNGFSNIVERTPKRMLEKEAFYIMQIESYVKEEKLQNTFHHKDIFNDTSIMTFPKERLLSVPTTVWECNAEPVYDDEQLEIIVKTS